MKNWLIQSLVAFDQLVNALVFGGWADETLSSRSYRLELAHSRWGFTRPLIDAIMFFQADHCRKAYESELLRLQSPVSERGLTL